MQSPPRGSNNLFWRAQLIFLLEASVTAIISWTKDQPHLLLFLCPSSHSLLPLWDKKSSTKYIWATSKQSKYFAGLKWFEHEPWSLLAGVSLCSFWVQYLLRKSCQGHWIFFPLVMPCNKTRSLCLKLSFSFPAPGLFFLKLFFSQTFSF